MLCCYDILSVYFYLMLVFVVGMSLLELVKNKYYKKHWRSYGMVDRGLLVGLVILHNLIYYVLYFTVFFIAYRYFYPGGGTVPSEKNRKNQTIENQTIENQTIENSSVALYLLICVLLLLHWRTNNNMCQLTVWQNRYMKIPDDEGFRDPYNVFNDIYFYKEHPYKRWRGQLYRYFIFGSIAFSLLTFF